MSFTHDNYSLFQEWMDYNLQWNESEYGGVKDLRITPNKLWKPDILMYNSDNVIRMLLALLYPLCREREYTGLALGATSELLSRSADEGFDGTYQTNVVVTHNGSCLYVPPGIFKSTCKIDITWFPFDDQHCDMKFGSWTYDGNQVDLVLSSEKGGDLSDFITNGEWYLIDISVGKSHIKHVEKYFFYILIYVLETRTLYYFFNLIVPCVLISSMALLGFTLPPDSGEKLTLGNVTRSMPCLPVLHQPDKKKKKKKKKEKKKEKKKILHLVLSLLSFTISFVGSFDCHTKHTHTHTHTYDMYISLSVYLSIYLSFYLSISLCILYVCTHTLWSLATGLIDLVGLCFYDVVVEPPLLTTLSPLNADYPAFLSVAGRREEEVGARRERTDAYSASRDGPIWKI
ncbi:Neuronal acetylcholine receptor subunit alpha-7 [Melipona quadrifasciata]|uniref:Neuronal acetylcholine receptor subunit alpha-7 n=1 Tax=Melipona quadrifasciata TaxID=166423 RepID=A0A0M9A0Y7_9HYME|nr:Neuronal acetylcholine receptor subunit alpha-7 [Melipona quadrifasciata]